MAGGVQPQLAGQARQEVARETLATIAWVGFGWSLGFFLLIAGYYALRYRLRRYKQSLFIAALALWAIVPSALVVGVIPTVVARVLVLVGAAGATVFLLALLDELRRGTFRKGQGDGVDSE